MAHFLVTVRTIVEVASDKDAEEIARDFQSLYPHEDWEKQGLIRKSQTIVTQVTVGTGDLEW